MEQWYRDARSYLKQYRFYHSVVSQPFEDWLGTGKLKRLQQMELYCCMNTNDIKDVLKNYYF